MLDLFDGCGDSCLGSCVEVAAFHHAAIRSVDRADMGSMYCRQSALASCDATVH